MIIGLLFMISQNIDHNVNDEWLLSFLCALGSKRQKLLSISYLTPYLIIKVLLLFHSVMIILLDVFFIIEKTVHVFFGFIILTFIGIHLGDHELIFDDQLRIFLGLKFF